MALGNTLLELALIVFNNFGRILLVALGLGIIFGMMGIINLAHGEFLMLGAYGTTLSYHQGIPLALAILIGGLVTGIIGVVVERLVLQHLYDRIVDSMVATWGLSLILIQSMLLIFGPTTDGMALPFGTLQLGSTSVSIYSLVLSSVAILMLVGVYLLYQRTEFGMHARATMQNEEVARSLGTDTKRIYMTSFFIGSVVTGIAGGLLAPLASVVPTMGQSYIIESFVAVIIGGANVLIGLPVSSGALSIIKGGTSQIAGTVIAQVLLLITAIIIVRVFPQGITDYLIND